MALVLFTAAQVASAAQGTLTVQVDQAVKLYLTLQVAPTVKPGSAQVSTLQLHLALQLITVLQQALVSALNPALVLVNLLPLVPQHTLIQTLRLVPTLKSFQARIWAMALDLVLALIPALGALRQKQLPQRP